MSETLIPSVGDAVKVWLPGETPWATCVAVHGNSTWDGRIDNRLSTEWTDAECLAVARKGNPKYDGPPLRARHNYKQGDVVTLGFSDDRERWVPQTD